MKLSNLWTLLAGAAMAFVCLTITPTAQAGSTFYFDANQSYRSAADSVFANGPLNSGGSFHLESFESGIINTPGLTVNHGSIIGPGTNTDSVDGDDGNINNRGRNGHSFSSGNFKSITFNFDASNGSMPNAAGLVFTDGHANARVTFKAWDAAGNLIGKIKVRLGDLVRNGTAGEDRFFGLTNDSGISRIQIASNYAGFEVDHVQFAYNYAVVPLPPALALGIAGLAGIGWWRRRAARLQNT